MNCMLACFFENACARTDDGTMCFGGEMGLNFFNPDSISFKEEPYKTVINELQIFNKTINVEKGIRFQVSGENRFSTET